MIAAQLPDGAALGRTTAALRPSDKARARHAGRRIGSSRFPGLSALDNFADLPNAGVSFVVLKPWDERSKAAGTDILSIAEAPAERRSTRRPTAGFLWCRRRRSRASATPAGCRCSSSCSAAASITPSCSDVTQQMSTRRAERSAIAARPDDVQPGRAACDGDGRPRTRPDPAGLGGRRVFHAVVLSRINLRQSVQQIRSNLPGLCAGRLAVPPAARRSSEPLCPQPATTRWSRSAQSRILGSRGRAVARHALQPLSLRNDHRRAGRRRQLWPGDRGDGGNRQGDIAGRCRLPMDRDVAIRRS